MRNQFVGLQSVGNYDEFRGMKTSEIPHSNDFPCSNPHCEVRFKMVLGIFYGDNVFCTSDCLKEWWEKKK